MYKPILIVLFFSSLLLSNYSNAQLMCNLGASPGQQYNSLYDQPPSQRASSELNTIYRILCPTGCGNYLLVQNQTVPNAMAAVIGSGQSKIVYNPSFLTKISQQFGGGATFGILAHEFGHHIDFHTTPSWMNNSWSRELKADAWAGCALARLGGSTNQIENSLTAIAAYPSASHPGWQQRHQALRTGFVNCGGNWSNQFNLSSNRTISIQNATSCQTRFGQCQLGQVIPVGNNCVCPIFDNFGRLVQQNPGVTR
jgi:hypothetical protein